MFDLIPDPTSSSAVRKFLLQFAKELIEVDHTLFLSYLLNAMYFLLASNSSESNEVSVLKEFIRRFDKIHIFIATMPVVGNLKTSHAASSNDPQVYWKVVRSTVRLIIESLASPTKSQNIKLWCLRFLECMLLFSLPLGEKQSIAARADPRLARSMKAVALPAASTSHQANALNSSEFSFNSTTTYTADLIPLHHPFINRNELVLEAEDVMSKALIWLTSNKSAESSQSGTLFSPSLMAVLAEVVANIAGVRPKYCNNAAAAIAFMISSTAAAGKSGSEVCQHMSSQERGSLARTTHRLLRLMSVSSSANEPDTQAAIGKLRSALTVLESLGIATAVTESNTALQQSSKKRPFEEEVDEDVGQVSSAAVEAVDAAERAFKLAKTQVSASSLARADKGIDDDSAVATPGTSFGTGDFTELAVELAQPAMSSLLDNIKLVSVLPTSSLTVRGDAAKFRTGQSIENMQRIHSPDCSQYRQLLLHFLQKQMDGFYESALNRQGAIGMKRFNIYCITLVRSVVSATLMYLMETDAENSLFVTARIIKCWASSVTDTDSIPASVTVIAPLWMFAGFALSQRRTNSSEAVATEEAFLKLDLLLMLCTSLYDRAYSADGDSNDSNEEEENVRSVWSTTYDNFCLACFSRLVQLLHLRTLAKSFLTCIPRVPGCILQCLKVLVSTGGKGFGDKDKGVRAEALHLLAETAVSSLDENSSRDAMCILLWFSVDADVEIRSKGINTIIGEVLKRNVDIDREVAVFAVHALVQVIDFDSSRLQSQAPAPPIMEMEDEHAPVPLPRLKDLLESYDYGELFNGLFASAPDRTDPSVAFSIVDGFAKRRIHLLSQICLTDVDKLSLFMDIFCSIVDASPGQDAAKDEKVVAAAAAEATEESKDDAKPPAATEGSSRTKKWNAANFLLSEIAYIVPALNQKVAPVAIVSVLGAGLSSHSNVHGAKAFFSFVLSSILQDYSSPPNSQLIQTVVSILNLPSHENTSYLVDWDAVGDVDFKLLLPLIGGFSTADVEACLPRIIRAFVGVNAGAETAAEAHGDHQAGRVFVSETLKSIFARIYKVRPPPMTKTALLVFLHRISLDSRVGQAQPALKQKELLDAIGVLMNNKMDFGGEVIKECLRSLLQDDVPPFALMRTAILSAQSFADVKKFVLSDVVPLLVQKAVWNSSTDLWKGVIFVAKNFASSTGAFKVNTEQSMRALLMVPTQHLRALLKAAPNVKPLLGTALQSLSAEDRLPLLAGDGEKEKLLKELGTGIGGPIGKRS